MRLADGDDGELPVGQAFGEQPTGNLATPCRALGPVRHPTPRSARADGHGDPHFSAGYGPKRASSSWRSSGGLVVGGTPGSWAPHATTPRAPRRTRNVGVRRVEHHDARVERAEEGCEPGAILPRVVARGRRTPPWTFAVRVPESCRRRSAPRPDPSGPRGRDRAGIVCFGHAARRAREGHRRP